ncbi:MAG: hypothetical protein K2K55_07250 [Duncaniella sp.]|nr:hypothetical protein [Duncaniella sp.]
MKKFSIAAVLLAAILTGCNGDKLRQAENENAQLKGDLKETLATQDSLLMLVNDIQAGMNQIKDLEKIISTPTSLQNETPSRKEQIRNDIIAIQQTIRERQERLAQLEARLSKLGAENQTLRSTIATLKGQIADQTTELSTLTNKLAEANIKIEELTSTVTGLNTEVDSLSTAYNTEAEARAMAEAEAKRAETQLNTVYYAIGTKKELKEKDILETGFLRKSKVMPSDFDSSYFTAADKRSLTEIALHSNKAKVLTSQPKESYTIEEAGGQKVLKITNPAKFWQTSNYLVIQVD